MSRPNLYRTQTCSKCSIKKTIKSWYANAVCSNCYTKALPRSYKRDAEKRYTSKNPEKLRAKWRAAYQRKKEVKKVKMREYRQRNLDKLREYDRKRWLTPERQESQRKYTDENRERVREVDRAEYRRNKYKHIARANGRRAHMGKATPKWADINAIAEFYKNCPKGYHVDHIIPLKGKDISGLHVLENLQYLPAQENLKKRNKWKP